MGPCTECIWYPRPNALHDALTQLPRFLRPLFLVVDLGFIAYWAITLAGVIPEGYLFKDYDNPILAAWNWSFLPLDLAISAAWRSCRWCSRPARG